MFVKICGVRNLKELHTVERFADATGVVVKAKSKRAVELNIAKEIISSAKIPVFTVSTEPTFDGWAEIIEKTKAEHIQVHSEMNVKEFEKLRKEFACIITKAFLVPEKSEEPEVIAKKLIEKALSYEADYYLFDTGKGSGKLHDLRISKEIAKKLDRTILAGGLNPENVAEIVNYVKPFGVDVSSGVEKDGTKDVELIKKFVGVLK
jgi:phosphoribosylanthranilate isomerase